MKFKETLLSQKRGKAELAVLLLYAVGTFVIMLFHEPWLDEAQSWQIARCASIREILFEIPHYEGHPPFWHLLLVPFAKLGAPYEITNHLINFCFCVPAIAVLLYKSPFPKVIRCALPFSYPLFYQLGVINRPYSPMMLAIFLAASCYPTRHKHPVRFVLFLCLFCLTSAYAVVIAGGICVAWTVEIFLEYRKSGAWKHLVRDTRPWCLCGILILALVLLALCYPAPDVFTNTKDFGFDERFFLVRYALMLPFDGLFGIMISEAGGMVTDLGYFLTLFAGILVWALMIVLAKANHKLLLLLCTYGGLAVFFALIYGSVHHVAVAVLCQIFFFWVLLAEEHRLPKWFYKIGQKIESSFTRKLAVLTACIAGCLPIYCAGVASYLEIQHPYGPRELADFLIENDLTERRIFAQCRMYYEGRIDTTLIHEDEDEEEDVEYTTVWDETLPAQIPRIKYMIPNIQYLTTAIQPYFEENPVANYNAGDPGKDYMLWRNERSYWEDITQDWEEEGLPEVCIGLVPLQYIFSEEELDGVEYVWVGTIHYGNVWRLNWDRTPIIIYLRSDLMDEYPQFEQIHYAYNDDY